MNRFAFSFTLLLSILSFSLHAQDNNVEKRHRFYLRPFIGVGVSNISANTTNPTYTGVINTRYNPVLSFNSGVNAGIQIKQLRIETGLQFLTTGRYFDFELTAFTPGTPGTTVDSIKVTEKHRHVLLPISAGHTFSISNKFSITPMAGVGIGRYMGVTSKSESYTTGSVIKKSSSINTSVNNAFIFWGNAFINFEYKISNRIAIAITPTFNRMITNALKEPPSAVYEFAERHWALTGNASVMIRL